MFYDHNNERMPHGLHMIKQLFIKKIGIKQAFIMICIIMGMLCQACEVHDYWMIPSSLTVDSEQDTYYAVSARLYNRE